MVEEFFVMKSEIGEGNSSISMFEMAVRVIEISDT